MQRVIILGAGVSGLVAAIELEKAGYAPTILEATDRVGGRVKSDIVNGYPTDHGFQVLLTAYPEAQRYLDYTKLDLIRFSPGSVIFKNGKPCRIGDPLRDFSFLWSTLSANIGSAQDKLRILKLSQQLRKKRVEAIFHSVEKSTLSYLQDFGLSSRIIHDFFQPFFAGIYLEEDLDTSSRMFEFVYKMFSTGHAAIPLAGMQSIPDHLAARLKNTTIRFHSAVQLLDGNTIILASGETMTAKHIIVSIDPGELVKQQEQGVQKWKSCYNLYFEASKSVLNDAIIGLVPGKDILVNNFHFLDDVFGNKGGPTLSVTVVKDYELSDQELQARVKQELHKHCGIETGKMLKMYHIKKALPDISSVRYAPTAEQAQLSAGVYCCGDYLSNGSLNAAMTSGRVAAELVIGS
ncbi:MAG: NAD(P)-binding protein [Saprospiraceae bacterium]|nr:NAD(P)-binding protein [Saprospiraceae bacterium]